MKTSLVVNDPALERVDLAAETLTFALDCEYLRIFVATFKTEIWDRALGEGARTELFFECSDALKRRRRISNKSFARRRHLRNFVFKIGLALFRNVPKFIATNSETGNCFVQHHNLGSPNSRAARAAFDDVVEFIVLHVHMLGLRRGVPEVLLEFFDASIGPVNLLLVSVLRINMSLDVPNEVLGALVGGP